MTDFDYPFLIFLLNAAITIRPEVRRNMVTGSGSGPVNW